MAATLIDAHALAERLADPAADVLVCDCRFDLADPHAGQQAYRGGHIPGAIYVSLDAMLSGTPTGINGRHPFPDRDAFAAAMGELGIAAGTQVVGYDASDGIYAARLWAMLRWLGHEAVAVLDGGLAAWTAAGGALSTDAPEPRPPGDLLAGPPKLRTVGYEEMREASEMRSHLLLDARAADRFRGENETLDKVGGHIPGAHNRHFKANLGSDGRFKPAAALREEFVALQGGRTPDTVIASCGSGVTACHNLLAMEVAGLPGAALYPGSWSEWSAQPGAAVETTSPS